MVLPPSKGQRELDEDELNELLNGRDELIPGAGLVQANWNIRESQQLGGGLRETTYVPTTTSGFEDDYDNYKVHDNGGVVKNKIKMGTIREEAEEQKSGGGGSDTGYFSHEEFNSREHYDSQEEDEFRKRQEQLLKADENNDDEDNVPYEDGDEDFDNSQEEAKRVQEEFGDENEEEEEEEESTDISSTMVGAAKMSETFQAEKTRQVQREIRKLNARKDELRGKMKRKVEEGTNLCGEKLFKECFEFFCNKAYSVRDIYLLWNNI